MLEQHRVSQQAIGQRKISAVAAGAPASWKSRGVLRESNPERRAEGFKYALVAGAISGGGLTVIANAPNRCHSDDHRELGRVLPRQIGERFKTSDTERTCGFASRNGNR